jgi:hypothetical protein
MSTFTRDNTDVSFEQEGIGQQRSGEAGGMVVALEAWKAGFDTTEMFADLPDGACQEPHWGYVIGGAFEIRYADGRTEKVGAGEAYHIEPGHNIRIVEDIDLVEFSRTDVGEGVNSLTGS